MSTKTVTQHKDAGYTVFQPKTNDKKEQKVEKKNVQDPMFTKTNVALGTGLTAIALTFAVYKGWVPGKETAGKAMTAASEYVPFKSTASNFFAAVAAFFGFGPKAPAIELSKAEGFGFPFLTDFAAKAETITDEQVKNYNADDVKAEHSSLSRFLFENADTLADLKRFKADSALVEKDIAAAAAAAAKKA